MDTFARCPFEEEIHFFATRRFCSTSSTFSPSSSTFPFPLTAFRQLHWTSSAPLPSSTLPQALSHSRAHNKRHSHTHNTGLWYKDGTVLAQQEQPGAANNVALDDSALRLRCAGHADAFHGHDPLRTRTGGHRARKGRCLWSR